MIITLAIIAIAFYWLLYETAWLTIRLPHGMPTIPDYSGDAGYRVYARLGTKKRTISSNQIREYNYNGHTNYDIVLQPGIDNVLCGWSWLDNHCGDLVNYQPKFHLERPGVKYDMVIKQPSIMKDIMRVNRLTKKQRLAYA